LISAGLSFDALLGTNPCDRRFKVIQTEDLIMAQSDERSLQQIRQETEQTRAELIHTVEQLRHSVVETSNDIRERVRPANIKSEMAHFVRSRGEQWLDAARENPLQAIAIGGALAYPALRLVRAVPLPLLMIGAGFYLAGSKNEKTLTERVSSTADQLREGIRQRVEGMSDQVSAEEPSGGVAQSAANVTDTVKRFADQATSTGQRYAEAARGASGDAVRTVKETAADLKGRANQSFADTLEQNPLAVVGVGLLIGGLIASALPRTDLEDDLLGETARSVKRRAQSAASRGFDAAKDAADEAGRRAYQQAEEEGLDPDGMRDTMGDVGERVKRVAEAAVTTAFEPPDEHEQSNQKGASSDG
jgi:hypothetical protein